MKTHSFKTQYKLGDLADWDAFKVKKNMKLVILPKTLKRAVSTLQWYIRWYQPQCGDWNLNCVQVHVQCFCAARCNLSVIVTDAYGPQLRKCFFFTVWHLHVISIYSLAKTENLNIWLMGARSDWGIGCPRFTFHPQSFHTFILHEPFVLLSSISPRPLIPFPLFAGAPCGSSSTWEKPSYISWQSD